MNTAITLTGIQLKDALTLIADDLESEITIKNMEAWKDPESGEMQSAGLYASYEEYPEFGLYGPLGASLETGSAPSPETHYCATCEHYGAGNMCRRWTHTSPVTGEINVVHLYAPFERDLVKHHDGYNSPDPCGPDGKHWKEALPAFVVVEKRPWWKRLLNLENAEIRHANPKN